MSCFKLVVLVFSVVVAFAAFVTFIAPDYRLISSDEDSKGTLDFLREVMTNDFTSYDDAQEGRDGDRNQTMVNSYYNMVTDFYEYGWGDSFHFAHTRENESHEDSIYRHECRLADELKLTKGKKAIDCGCGVGGPARGVARHSGAHVTGVTLNAYQVKRAAAHNERKNLAHLVNVEQGDFTDLKYDEGTFDGAYAVEATCHAPTLEDAYGEIFRVLKPGGRFASYEWIVTADFDANNPEHVQINKEIEYGNGLPPLRNRDDILKAAEAVGFKYVSDEDLAQDHVGTKPWYHKLDIGYWSHRFTHFTCQVMEFFKLAPPGTTDVSSILMTAAKGLVEGGKKNTFTPMHLFVFEKPE